MMNTWWTVGALTFAELDYTRNDDRRKIQRISIYFYVADLVDRLLQFIRKLK